MKILIVDDNQVNLFVIEKILKRAGYEDFTSLTSAQEMYDYLEIDGPNKESSVDIILLDIMMPDIDGITACRKLQSIPHLKDIPVIFVTALEDSNKVAEALDVGGIDYILKPINKVDLLARIRVGLRLKYEKDWHRMQEEKIRNELDLSMQVQSSLLSEPVAKDKLLIKASYLPANKLAGDMYYWHQIDKDRYAVILLDMMGHGITASLVCMFISSVLRDAIRTYTDPTVVITELNRWMNLLNKEDNEVHYYFTAIYMIIDTNEKTVEYVNAGHPPGFAMIDDEEIHPLSTGSCPVGFFPEMKIEKATLSYKDKIQLLLFTDGVMEAVEKDGIDGLEQLKAVISEKWLDCSDEEPINFVMPQELQKDQPDDMCVVFIQAH
ncbi:fused response regulator/phosphatase [Peribacillus psychrosaccharolyticus]|uniref:Fused response regulator/phosphatase n=1 Tax=Peribacillus psychrosaccharolyticus TaxID=1407 RepID=A0A974NJ30_PERPY|nr:fused response regulator/phosphatase [Peribacillus psychrosaccharolyticus]MEC2057833.1 fused response regulator/phosphatase [Peribacillus psychrosaccharolyticus]MED3744524.1 fused response regulator/phosphatase [Peribacillus psychrosaccharolyticus]QQS98652.1 fused response regulator/phosphatase [Peribacillus psychrosaccharolyticus]